ncbi:MAG: general stress protein B [Candidatus Sericytochromatia bacterium]|nr:general stress protein B [Candidatus Sericytochromatia bacterium]
MSVTEKKGQAPKERKSPDMTVREAGQKGGEATKREVESGELPKDFYSRIGHKGGQKGGETTKREVESGQLPKDFYSQIGHKGGEIGGHKGGEATKREVESGELPRDFYSQIGHKGGQKVKDLIEKGKEAAAESEKKDKT